jgi:hypothetical protein
MHPNSAAREGQKLRNRIRQLERALRRLHREASDALDGQSGEEIQEQPILRGLLNAVNAAARVLNKPQ